MANITKINVDEIDYKIQGTLYDELGENIDGGMTQNAITTAFNEIQENFIVGYETEIDLSNYSSIQTFPSISNAWITGSDTYPYYGIFIYIEKGARYYLKSNNQYTFVYCFLTTNSHSNGATVNYATGATRRTLAPGKYIIETAPEDASYLYVSTFITNDTTPEKISKYRKELISDFVSSIEDTPSSISEYPVKSSGIARAIGKPTIFYNRSWNPVNRLIIGVIRFKAGNTYIAQATRTNTDVCYIYICSGNVSSQGTVYMKLGMDSGVTESSASYKPSQDITANIVVSGDNTIVGLNISITEQNNNLLWTSEQQLTNDEKTQVISNIGISEAVNAAMNIGKPMIYYTNSWSSVSKLVIGTIYLKAGNTYIAHATRTNTDVCYIYICSGNVSSQGTIYMRLGMANNITESTATYKPSQDITANIVVAGAHAIAGLNISITQQNNSLLWTSEQQLTDTEKMQVLNNLGITDNSQIYDIITSKSSFEEDIDSIVSPWMTNDDTVWSITNVDGHNASLTNVTKTGGVYVGINLSSIDNGTFVRLKFKINRDINSSDIGVFASLSSHKWNSLKDIDGKTVAVKDGIFDITFSKTNDWLVFASNSFNSNTTIIISEFTINKVTNIRSLKKIVDNAITSFAGGIIPYDYIAEKYWEVSASNQGATSYGNYVVGVNSYNGNGCWIKILDIPNKTVVRTYLLATDIDTNTYTHANTVSFGPEKYSEDDIFPLLYIDTGTSTNGSSKVYVCRLEGQLSEITVSVIQTIYLEFNVWTDSFCDEKGRLWVKTGSIITPRFRCYNLPSFTTSEATIDSTSMPLADFTLPKQTLGFDATRSRNQCCMYHKGKIYYVSGVPAEQHNVNFMSIIDVRSECREAVIWLEELGLSECEPESCFIVNNQLYISVNAMSGEGHGNIYKIKKTDNVETNNNVKKSGTFANVPTSTEIYEGFEYFCTDRQTPEGASNGIMIYHKGNDVWVDALGRTIS